MAEKFKNAIEEAAAPGFNVFKIISDKYYTENFHGDILMAFLNPNGEHGEVDKFLKVFLDMIEVEITNYGPNTCVEREKVLRGEERGRIDFVIKDESTRHCVIIENKLYDAHDMNRQLPRYYREMKDYQGYNVDAIVYLPMSIGKRPMDLDKGEDEKVKAILQVIPVLHPIETEKSLVRNWIEPCIDATSDIDCLSVLRQYKRLIVSLKPETMKYESTMELYEFLLKDGNLAKIDSLKELIDGSGENLAIRLEKKLNEGGIDATHAGSDKNGRVVNLANGRQIWIFCGDSEHGVMDYTMRIPNKDNSEAIDLSWLSEELAELRKNLEKRIKEYQVYQSDKRYIQFKLNEEEKLLNAIKKIKECADKKLT